MNLIFACVTGSHLYGTNRPDSDWDIRGVCLNPKKSLLGFTGFEQYLPGKEEAVQFSTTNFGIKSDDVQIYGLNKFLQLALDANPNIIELFFAENLAEYVYHSPHIWNQILRNKEYILSTKVIHTFSGYAYSQLSRIKGHKRWLDSPPAKPNSEEYSMVLTDKGGQKWTDSNKYNQYQSLLKDYTSYLIWLKERNPARKSLEEKYGYDTKHAMHLYRLLLEAEELLLTGEIKFPFTGNKLETLRQILNGQFLYESIVQLGENAKDTLASLESKSVLPKKPNILKVEDMLIEINYKLIKDEI